jgi:hypothetical protein
MEAYGHHPVRGVKSLFNTIAVVDVNIYVEDSLMIPALKAYITSWKKNEG